ncbi:hypothetical protein Ocin01_18960 [Orchesella cincta]|uniref:Uncharacterized protein n=1 Tax=Orchesella cincta TaxID=48709 RepID=A0A1D2M481_ORCCI|nr:hypothetical protein Ocin01_18960 [Orchesella cincta]
MNWKAAGLILTIAGLTVLIISIIVLRDGINHQNAKWEIHNAPYLKHGYDIFWEQFKFDEDILIVISSLSILVGTVQFFLPFMFCCLKQTDMKRNIQLWIGTNLVLAFVATACFALCMVYDIASVGMKGPDHLGRLSALYDSWTYTNGIAYVVIIFCDMVVLYLTTLMMARWSCTLSNRDRQEQSNLY